MQDSKQSESGHQESEPNVFVDKDLCLCALKHIVSSINL